MSPHADLLVVDDEQVVRGAVRKICAEEGLAVDEASSVEAGLSLLNGSRYRIVLVDLMLPVIGGLRFLETSQREHRQTPVVMITGYATPGRTLDCLRRGAFDVLPKPFDADELLAVLRRAMKFGAFENQQRTGPTMDMNTLFRLGQHAWARIEAADSAWIGIGESFRPTFGELTGIETPTVESELVQGKSMAKITTRDGLVHRVWSPLGGRILETNRTWKDGRLDETPSPWVLRVVPSDLENELERLTHI